MKTAIHLFLFIVLAFQLNAQATLTIENDSRRSMTVKVMEGYGRGSLHEQVTIPSYGSRVIRFYSTGHYFTKTKAVLKDRKTIYQKGEPFRVVNDDTGYSVMTLTYSIIETEVPTVTGGKEISKAEFDQD